MIVHQYADNSVFYEYEVGDKVLIARTIHGGWLSAAALEAGTGVVRKVWSNKYYPRRQGLARVTARTAMLEVEYSTVRGLAQCYPWMLSPSIETLTSASLVISPE